MEVDRRGAVALASENTVSSPVLQYMWQVPKSEFLQVDCTAEVQLCRDHVISGFPSIRVFRKGSDEVANAGYKDHEAYRGDRTVAALTEFADGLVPSAGQPHNYVK